MVRYYNAYSLISWSYIYAGKLEYSNQQLIAAQERRPEQGKGHVSSWAGLGEQPCYLERARRSSASRRAAIPHAQAVRNWSSASLVNFTANSTASHSFAVLFSLLACHRFKVAWASGPGGSRAVHGVKQRQITELGSTANIALRKNVAARHHSFRLTSELWY